MPPRRSGMHNKEKSARSHSPLPDYEKMQADSVVIVIN